MKENRSILEEGKAVSDRSAAREAFRDYDSYMESVFDCVNQCLYQYLEDMKTVYSNGQGGYKNVLYPDLEIASDTAHGKVQKFRQMHPGRDAEGEEEDGTGTWDFDMAEDAPEDDPARIELELLSELVSEYSEEHFAIGEPSLIDVLKLRMYELGLTQKGLADLIGISPSRLSDLLSGKCEPTIKTARTISRELDIDAAIVLGV